MIKRMAIQTGKLVRNKLPLLSSCYKVKMTDTSSSSASERTLVCNCTFIILHTFCLQVPYINSSDILSACLPLCLCFDQNRHSRRKTKDKGVLHFHIYFFIFKLSQQSVSSSCLSPLTQRDGKIENTLLQMQAIRIP